MSSNALAALLLASVAALSAPAYAATGYGSDNPDIFYRSAFATIAALKEKGVNAHDVEQWGDYVRAFVVDDQGRVTFQLFDRDYLNPAKIR